MATPTDVSININHQLRMLEADISDMRALLDAWDTAPAAERRLWEAEWPAVAALLDQLCRLQREDALTAEQRRSLTTLLEQSQSLSPMLRQHGFAVPNPC